MTNMQGLSSAIKLADLDDFILPAVDCIKPILNAVPKSAGLDSSDVSESVVNYRSVTRRRDRSKNKRRDKNVLAEGGTRGSLEIEGISSRNNVPNDNTQTSLLRSPVSDDNRSSQPSNGTTEPAITSTVGKISLYDCLSCSGCLTSAEVLLVNHSNTLEFLVNVFLKPLTVVSISSQTVTDFSAVTSLPPRIVARKLSFFFKLLGVDYVFDMSISESIALLETQKEFIERYRMDLISSEEQSDDAHCIPLLTSHCPGWICYAEKMLDSKILGLISNVKSSQQIQGFLIKTYLLERLNVCSFLRLQAMYFCSCLGFIESINQLDDVDVGHEINPTFRKYHTYLGVLNVIYRFLCEQKGINSRLKLLAYLINRIRCLHDADSKVCADGKNKNNPADVSSMLNADEIYNTILEAITKRKMEEHKRSNLPFLCSNDIYHVTIMPCYDKKIEAIRPEYMRPISQYGYNSAYNKNPHNNYSEANVNNNHIKLRNKDILTDTYDTGKRVNIYGEIATNDNNQNDNVHDLGSVLNSNFRNHDLNDVTADVDESLTTAEVLDLLKAFKMNLFDMPEIDIDCLAAAGKDDCLNMDNMKKHLENEKSNNIGDTVQSNNEEADSVNYINIRTKNEKYIKKIEDSVCSSKVIRPTFCHAGSGGYAEHVFRYAAKHLFNLDLPENLEYISGSNNDIKEIVLKIDGEVKLRFAVAYGFRNIQNVVQNLKARESHKNETTKYYDYVNRCNSRKAYDFVEIMACPGGCLNGGGQISINYLDYMAQQSDKELSLNTSDYSFSDSLSTKYPIIWKLTTIFTFLRQHLKYIRNTRNKNSKNQYNNKTNNNNINNEISCSDTNKSVAKNNFNFSGYNNSEKTYKRKLEQLELIMHDDNYSVYVPPIENKCAVKIMQYIEQFYGGNEINNSSHFLTYYKSLRDTGLGYNGSLLRSSLKW